MEPFANLASRSLEEITATMAGSQEGSLVRGYYMAEIIRRQTKAQVAAADTAKWSILVACVAIVVAAGVQIWATLSA